MLTGVGVDIGFGSALVVVLAADLLAGFVPVPGGVGVAEAVMTGFLVALGVDEPAALAATVAYRFITFYLPVIDPQPYRGLHSRALTRGRGCFEAR